MTDLPARHKPPTIREVARAAGVSTALVSIVFRDAPGASETTRARVFAAAAQLGYEIVLSLITAAHDESHAIETLMGFRCESAILLGSQLAETRLGELARELPLVLAGRQANLGHNSSPPGIRHD